MKTNLDAYDKSVGVNMKPHVTGDVFVVIVNQAKNNMAVNRPLPYGHAIEGILLLRKGETEPEYIIATPAFGPHSFPPATQVTFYEFVGIMRENQAKQTKKAYNPNPTNDLYGEY